MVSPISNILSYINEFLYFRFLNSSVKIFHQGDYGSVLKGYSVLNTNQIRYVSYRNIIRISALIFTSSPKWFSEYNYVIREHQLDLLGLEDKKYIILYVFLISKGQTKNHFYIKEINSSKVSKRTKKYFPWSVEEMKVALEKYPDDERGVAQIEFI